MSHICAVVGGRKILFSCPNDFLGTYIVAPVHVVHPVQYALEGFGSPAKLVLVAYKKYS
jgi:hypothetical protein